MAVVYKASKIRDGDFRRGVCIKQILPTLSDNPEFVKMFKQEARIAASLDHPNIVAVTDFNRVEGQLFLEMELVQGIDLERLLRLARELGMTLSLGFTRYVTTCLLAALAHAHGQVADGKPAPVIHRDVSPANILLSTKGEVKLTDFGIAKVRGSAVVTQTGDVKGKFSYLSPEQARGGELDQRSDLFSAGLVLYELLTGRRFNRGQDQGGEVGQAMEPRDPAVPWLSTEWNDLLTRILARELDDRFQSADAALDVLERIPSTEEPYDHNDVGRLVRRVRELMSDPRGPRPIDLGVEDEEGDAEASEELQEAPTRISSSEIPAPPADKPKKGQYAWVKAAVAFAAALGLFMLANHMMKEATGDDEVQGPGTLAADGADGGVESRAVAATGVDAGEAEQGEDPDAGAGQDDQRRRAAASGPGFGRLEVNCRPWAQVSVDGKGVGTTPIKDLKVRAGKRRVTLSNDELGYERSFSVDVPRGGVGSLSKEIAAVDKTTNPYQ
jgi:serine/threonine protein kinase